MNRLTNDEVKRLVVERSQLVKQRDALTAGLSPDSIQKNPLQLMTALPGLLDAFKLTGRIEEISGQLVSELVQRVAEGQRAIGG